MRSDQAKTIAILDFLEQVEGIQPAKKGANHHELWFHSPIREGDKSPSFKVDTHLNLWFDHGIAKGGNIIDLVCAIKQVSVRDALAILEQSQLATGRVSTHRPYANIKPTAGVQTSIQRKQADTRASAIEKEKHVRAYQLLREEVITHPALIEYLQARHIDLEIAKLYLKEIHFKHPDKLQAFFELGFKSGDGYEARNKFFKGFVGTGKAISILEAKHPEQKELLVFEGCMDFLSYLTFLKHDKAISELTKSVVVLNSTSLKNQLVTWLEDNPQQKLYCFLDNDEAGKATYAYFQEALEGMELVDMSYLYAGYKDFNEKSVNSKPE